MSGSRPLVGIRISSEGGEKARRDIEALGPAGEAAMRRVAAASAAATPEMQRLAAASDVANRAFVGMGGSLGRVGSVFTGVSGVTAGVTAGFTAMAAAAALSAVAIAKAGDTANAAMARLTSSTGSLQAASTAYEGLFRLSQQTGVAVADSAGAFSRFSVAAKEVGATNDQVLRLVGGLQKAAIVSGSTGQEASAAMQQIGQALASGTLQGDELRSVLEAMPQFAQALARELGVTIGQLKQMGSEGKLQADVIFPAMLKAGEAMSAEFDKMPKTMAQASSILGEATGNFLAKLDNIVGASQLFRDAMLAGAGAINTMSGAIAPSDRQRAESGVASARATIAARERDIALLRETGPERMGFRLPEGSVAAQARAKELAQQQEALAKAQEQLRGHEAMLTLIENDGRRVRGEEATAAEMQRQASARATAATSLRTLEKDLKTEASIREAARKKNAEIDKIERDDPSVDPQRIAALRAAAAKEEADAIAKLTETRKADGKAAADANEHIEAFHKAQQKAADEAVKAQEKATQAREKYVEASRDALLNIPERALDRLGDSLVDAFVRGEGAAVNFGNIMRSVIASAVADITKLGLINPLMNSVFTSSSGPRPTLAGAFGGSSTSTGLGDALGLGQLLGGKGLGESLGLTGSSGILSTPLWSTGGGYSFTAGGGLVAPGSVSLGGLLGGAGAGFGAGMLLNGMLGGNSTGGTVGSGVGGLAGAAIGSLFPGVGTLLGGLIGGGLGGGLGGLIGPGESVKGYGYRLQPGENGMLSMGSTFYNESGKAAFDEAAAGIAQLNQYLGARGITVGGSVAVGGNKDGPDYSNASAGTFAEGVSQLYYRSNNAQLDYAIANQRGRQFGSSAEMQTFVEGFYQASDALTALTAKPIPAFIQQLSAVNDNFGAAIAKANEYGLAVGEVTAAQQDAVAKLFEARAEQLRQSDIGLDIREMTAKGDTQGAELARQAESARQEVASFGDALDALGLTAEEKADRLVRLEEVQAAERAAIITRYGQQSADALRNSFESIRGLSASLSARGFAASGDNQAADLARQEAAAKQETKAAQNAITNVSREGAARLAALAQTDAENRARAVRAALDSEALLNSPEQGSTEERAAAFARNSDIAAGALRAADAARQEVDALNADLARAAQEGADTLVEIERVQAAERAAIIKSYADQAAAEAKRQAEAGNALLRQLAYGGLSALSPSAKYFSAMTDLNTAKSALDAGGSLSDYTQVASAVLPVARDYLGTSTRYAGLAAEVGQVLQANGGDGSLSAILSAQANTGDAQLNLTADIGSRTISELTAIRQAFERLATGIDAIIQRKVA